MASSLLTNVCPVCSHRNIQVWRANPQSTLDLYLCHHCSFIFQPPITDAFNYDMDYYEFWDLQANLHEIRQMKILSAFTYLQMIQTYAGVRQGQLLDVGCAYGFLLEAAKRWGYQAIGVDISPAVQYAQKAGFEVYKGDIMDIAFTNPRFNAVTLIDVIEHISTPKAFCTRLSELLAPGGALLIMTPNVFSVSRQILGHRWFHFKPEHTSYFSPRSLSTLLLETGFQLQYIGRGYKHLSYQYILNHLLRYNKGVIASGLQFLGKLLPSKLILMPLRYPTGMLCVATKP